MPISQKILATTTSGSKIIFYIESEQANCFVVLFTDTCFPSGTRFNNSVDAVTAAITLINGFIRPNGESVIKLHSTLPEEHIANEQMNECLAQIGRTNIKTA